MDAALGRSEPVGSTLSLGATAAVAAMSVMATGDVLLAAVLLAIAAADVAAGPAVVMAAVAALVRWGTPSLAGIGADQAVLGVSGVVGPPLAAASAWCAAVALVTVPRRAPIAAVGTGCLGALIVAGPTDTAGWWVRVLTTVGAVLVSILVARVAPRRLAVAVSTLVATLALTLAVVA